MGRQLHKLLTLLALTTLIISLLPPNTTSVTAGSSDDEAVTTSPTWVKRVLIKGPVLDVDYDSLIKALVVGTPEGAYLVSTEDPTNVTTLLEEEVSKVSVNGEAGEYVLVTPYGVEAYSLDGSLRWFRKLGYSRPLAVDLSSEGFTALTFMVVRSGSITSRMIIYGPSGELVVNVSINALATNVAWSPSGNYLIIKDYSDGVVLYSFKEGSLKPLQTFKEVYAASWNGSRDVLALSDTHGILKLIDLPDGKVRTYYVGLTPQTIAWGPDDAEILLGGRERVAVLNLKDGEVRYSRHLMTRPVNMTWLRGDGVAVILRGVTYASSARAGYALLLLDPNLTPVASVTTINGTPLGIYPSGDGALVVTTSGIWVLSNLRATLSTYKPVTGDYAEPQVPSIADEYHVALLVRKSHSNGALYDHLLYVTYSSGVVWERPIAWDVRDIDVSKDALLVAVVGDYLYVFNASDGSLLWSDDGGGSGVMWDPKAELLAVTEYGKLVLYDREGNLVGSVETHHASEKPLWSPDGSYVAVPGFKEVLVFGRNLSKVTEIRTDTFPVRVQWDPSGKYLWVASEEAVGKFGLDGVQVANVSLGRYEDVYAFSVSPDGNLIAVASMWGKVYVFSTEGGSPLWIKEYEGIDAVPAWSSDGGKLLIVVPYSSGRGEVILCRSNGGEIYRDFVDGSFVDGRVVDELKSILLVGWDGVVYINYTDGTLPWSTDEELVGLLRINYAPQGRAVLVNRYVIRRMGSSGYRPQVRIYDMNGDVMHEFNYSPGNTVGATLQLSRDGNLVLVVGTRMNYSILEFQARLRMYDVNGTKLWDRTFNVSDSESLPLWLVGSDKIVVPITYKGRVATGSSTAYRYMTLYTIVILNQYTGVEIARTEPSEYPVRELIPGDGGYFAAIYDAFEGDVIKVYDGNASFKGVVSVKGHVHPLSLSRYANVVAYGLRLGYGEYRLVTRRLNGDIIKSINVNTSIHEVSVSRKGLVAVMYDNRTLAVYTPALKLVAREVLPVISYIYYSMMSWSPSSNYLAVYAGYFSHGEVRVYDAGLKLLSRNYVDGRPQIMAWVNDSTLFVAGAYGGEFVSVSEAPPSLSLASPGVGGHVIKDYVLTSKYLYLLLDGGSVAVIDVKSGAVLTQKVLSSAPIYGIAAHEDLLATYGPHGTINVYRVEGNSLKHVLTFTGLRSISDIDVSGDAVAVTGYGWIKVLGLDGNVKWSRELGGSYVSEKPELDPATGYLVCGVDQRGVIEAVIYSPTGKEVLRYPLKDYGYFYRWVSDGLLLLYDGGSAISLIDVRSGQSKYLLLKGVPMGVFADKSLKVAYVSTSKGSLLRITADGQVTGEGVPTSRVVGVGSDGSAYLISMVNPGQLLKYSPSKGTLTEYQVLGSRVFRTAVAELSNGDLLVVSHDVRIVKPVKYGLLILLPSNTAVKARINGEEYLRVKGGLRLYVAEGTHKASFKPAEKLEEASNLIGSTEWLANLTVTREYDVKAGHVIVDKLPSINDFLKSVGAVALDASSVKVLKYSCVITWVDGNVSKVVSPGQVLRLPALPGEYALKCTPSLLSDVASRILTTPKPMESTIKVESGSEATMRLKPLDELYGMLVVRNDAEAPVKYTINWEGGAPISKELGPGSEATYYASPGKYYITIEYLKTPTLDVGDAEALRKASTLVKEVSINAGKQYVITPAKQVEPAHLIIKGAPGQEFIISWGRNQKTFKILENGTTKLVAAPYTEYVIKAEIAGAQPFTKRIEPLPPGGKAEIKLPQPSTTTATTTQTTAVTTTSTVTVPKAKQPNYAPIIAAIVTATIAVITILTYRRRKTT